MKGMKDRKACRRKEMRCMCSEGMLRETGNGRTGKSRDAKERDMKGRDMKGNEKHRRRGKDRSVNNREGGLFTNRASGLHDRTASTMSSKSLYITLSHPSTAAT